MQKKLNNLINQVIIWHSDYAKSDRKKFRGHDGITPYYMHPLGIASWTMEDNNGALVDSNKRFIRACVQLLHDIVEDTNISFEDIEEYLLSINFSVEEVSEIISGVKSLTFEKGGSSEEFKYLKENQSKIEDSVFYDKLADKLFNIIGSIEYFQKKGSLEMYLNFLKFLRNKVATGVYKDSAYVRLADGILASYMKK